MNSRAINLMKFNLEVEKSKMNGYSDEIRDFRKQHGFYDCDYLRYRIEMELFHRGRVNLLINLIKELES